MSTRTPRDYQRDAVTGMQAGWARGFVRQMIVLGTGMGKTFTSTLIARAALETVSGPIVFLAHRTELLDQAQKTFAEEMADIPMTRLGGGVRRAQPGPGIVLGMIQGVSRDADLLGHLASLRPSLVIVDECHHSPSASYQYVLAALGCFDDVRALGLTATPARTDNLKLGDTWQR